MLKNYKIRVVESGDIEAAVDVLSKSFANDPFFVWAIDNYSDRLKVVGDYYRMYMLHCLENGVSHLAYTKDDGILGVSVWLANNARGSSLGDEMERVVGKYVDRFRLFGNLSYAFEPQDTVFSQLLGFGVVPSATGLGIGSALLTHHQQEIDQLGIPSYLEASSRRTAGGVYRRAG